MMKLTGAEFNAFMVDPAVWTEGKWYDDLYAEVDGVPHDLDIDFAKDPLPVSAKVRVEGGCLYRDGGVNSTFDDFESALRKWLKARTVTIVTLEVPNSQMAALKNQAKDCKWRIL